MPEYERPTEYDVDLDKQLMAEKTNPITSSGNEPERLYEWFFEED